MLGALAVLGPWAGAGAGAGPLPPRGRLLRGGRGKHVWSHGHGGAAAVGDASECALNGLRGPKVCRAGAAACRPHANPYLNGLLAAVPGHTANCVAKAAAGGGGAPGGPGRACAARPDCGPGQLCTDGRCVCPVLYSGDAACAKITRFPTRWCLSPMTAPHMVAKTLTKGDAHFSFVRQHSGFLREGEDLIDAADFSSCAVVGSAPLKGKGAEIDAHTAVFRCNDAPTRGYERHVGAKTTVRLQNRDFFGSWEGDEVLIPYTRPKVDTDGMRRAFARGRAVLPTIIAKNYFMGYWELNKPPKVKSNLKKSKNKQVSAGFAAIMVAMHLCGRVTVYGFGQAGKGHYYQHKRNRKKHATPVNERHQWNFENACKNQMKEGKLTGVRFDGG